MFGVASSYYWVLQQIHSSVLWICLSAWKTMKYMPSATLFSFFGPLIGFSWNIPLFAFVSSFPFSRALLSYVGSVCFWIWAREAVSPIFVFDITVTFHFCILALNFSGTTPWIVYLWTLVTLNTFVGPTKHRRHPAGKSPNINVGLVGQRIAQRQHVGCSVHFVLSEA